MNKRMKHFVMSMFLITFCLVGQGHAEMLRIDYVKVASIDKKKTSENVSVVLDENRFLVKEKSFFTLVDLDKEQIIILDNYKKSYILEHLYSRPFFARAEMKNREMLAKIIEAAGIDKSKDSFDTFYSEGELGIKSDVPSKSKIQLTTWKTSLTAKYKGRVVTKAEFSNFKLARKYKNSFDKYLIYFEHLHPDIRKKIINSRRLFKELFYIKKRLGDAFF